MAKQAVYPIHLTGPTGVEAQLARVTAGWYRLAPVSLQHRPWRQSYEAGVPDRVEPIDRPFDAIFAAAAAATPSRPALTFVNRTYTYAELDNAIGRAAAALQRDGLAPGDAVWIDLPPCAHWWMAVLGTLRAGGVPLLARDAGRASPRVAAADPVGPVRACIVGRARPTGAVASGGPVIVVDPGTVLPRSIRVVRAIGRRFGGAPGSDGGDAGAGGLAWDAWLGRPGEPHPAARAADAAALCLAAPPDRGTGSILFTHRHLVAGAHQLQAWLPDAVPGADTWLVLAPLAGGLGAVAALGAAALLQARVVVVPRAALEEVRDVVRHLRPAYVVSTGDVVTMLAQDPRLAQCDMRGVRAWLAGDPLDQEVLSAFQDVTGLAPCTGLGGAAVAGLAICHPVNAPVRPTCVGLPLPSVDVRVRPGGGLAAGVVGVAAAGGAVAGRLEVSGPNVAADGWLDTGVDACVDAAGFVCLPVADRRADPAT